MEWNTLERTCLDAFREGGEAQHGRSDDTEAWIAFGIRFFSMPDVAFDRCV